MKLFRLMIPVLSILLVAFDCSDDDSTSPGSTDTSGVGTLKVMLTDAPGDYDAVNVTFSDVSIHYAEGDSTGEPEEETPDSSAVAKTAVAVHATIPRS